MLLERRLTQRAGPSTARIVAIYTRNLSVERTTVVTTFSIQPVSYHAHVHPLPVIIVPRPTMHDNLVAMQPVSYLLLMPQPASHLGLVTALFMADSTGFLFYETFVTSQQPRAISAQSPY